MEYFQPQSTDLDDMGKPRHKMHGKRGPWLEAKCKDGVVRYFAWQNRGAEIVRGADRKGIKAKDFGAEAVWENELTSPRVEIPRVVIETMQCDIKRLGAQDVAVFWRLFAEARLRGIEQASCSITLSALKSYLDVATRHRILASLEKLSAAIMLLHVNQQGAHGRVSMPMLDCYSVDGDTITFALPRVLRQAVLVARDYAWIDINAVARFSSKFTTALYFKLCLEAGKHFSKRSIVEDTRAEFRDRVGLPSTTKSNVLEDVLHRVRADILGISGCRRRFDVSFTVGAVDGRMEIVAGTAAKKLKELKPTPMTRASLHQVAQSNRGAMSVPVARYPSLVRLRQAATLLDTSVLAVSDIWRLDYHAATSYPEQHLLGMRGDQFVGLIDEYGADAVLEFWADKRDFSTYPQYRVVRNTVDVGEARDVSKKTLAAVEAEISNRVIEEVEEVADEYKMVEDFGVLEYGVIQMPSAESAADDYDDMDIPF